MDFPALVTEFILELAPLAVGGVPVAVLTFLVVEMLSYVELLTTPLSKRRAVAAVAVVLGGLWAFGILAEATELTTRLVIDTCVLAITGALVAALIHRGYEAVQARLSAGRQTTSG